MQRAHKEYNVEQHPDASHSYARQHPDSTDDTSSATPKYMLRVPGGGICNKETEIEAWKSAKKSRREIDWQDNSQIHRATDRGKTVWTHSCLREKKKKHGGASCRNVVVDKVSSGLISETRTQGIELPSAGLTSRNLKEAGIDIQ
jgi:hypothetical protein